LVIKGREDDNIETIRKRFKVFLESSLPVVEYYDSKGKVQKVTCSCNCFFIEINIA
jgi:adenylate kinase family enzyme